MNKGSSKTLLMSHLHDQNKALVLPTMKDLQAQCKESPTVYDVIVHHAGSVEGGGVLLCAGDSYYRGDMIFLVTNMPKFSKSKQYEVTRDDVHQWLINGSINSIESVQMQIA